MKKIAQPPLQRLGVRRVVALLAASLLLASAMPAAADEYDDERSGHPARIIGYILHPVGVILDYLILRPAHWIGSHEPFSTLFGHDEED
jgi:hypothetical protein